jgi:hypothetical protein
MYRTAIFQGEYVEIGDILDARIDVARNPTTAEQLGFDGAFAISSDCPGIYSDAGGCLPRH